MIPTIIMSCYGGVLQMGAYIKEPYDLRWNIDNVNHTFINGTGSNQIAPTVFAGLIYFTFTPGPESCFCFRDCLFQYVDYSSTATNIYSASDTITTGNFIQFFDCKWIGLTSNGTSYVPQKFIGNMYYSPSTFIIYEGISNSGTVAFSGGLQTGAAVLAGAIKVTDTNTVLTIPAPAGVTTLSLPSPTNKVYIGKWIVIYNSGTGTINISCSGPANNTVIANTQSRTFVNYDGTNWIVVAGFP